MFIASGGEINHLIITKKHAAGVKLEDQPSLIFIQHSEDLLQYLGKIEPSCSLITLLFSLLSRVAFMSFSEGSRFSVSEPIFSSSS